MSYMEMPTLQEITDRIITNLESRLTNNTPLLTVSLLRILARVFAGAVYIAYGFIDRVAQYVVNVNTSIGSYLVDHAYKWNVPPQAATFSVRTILFTGVESTVIPIDTYVQAENGILFKTQAQGTITSGEASISCIALEAGIIGNIEVGSTVTLIAPITDINTEATVSAIVTDGEDAETEEQIRTNILEVIANPPSGGTASDYVRWCKEVDGVASAWPFPLAKGPGTVDVVIKSSATDPVPTQGLLDAVAAYLADGRQPLAADVGVEGIVKVEIYFAISIEPYTAVLAAAVRTNLQRLIEEEAEPGGTLLISHIQNALISAGVSDFSITSIVLNPGGSQSIANVVLTGYNYLIYDDDNTTIGAL